MLMLTSPTGSLSLPLTKDMKNKGNYVVSLR